MRSSQLCSVAALLVVLGLSACGGKESFSVNGTINRLDFPGLVLANGSDTVRPPAVVTPVVIPPATIPRIPFVFPNRIDYGTEYNVTVQTQPDNMNCTVAANGRGSAGRTEAINATVTCTVNSYTVGGTITGLTGTGLVLSNGTDPVTVSPAAGATTFVFTSKVNFGQVYGVGVLTQPSNPVQNCTVSGNGTGTMGAANVADIVVSCTTPAP